MTQPLYVVLVNFNGWRDTIECLESVLRSDYEDTRAIVVDNGSTDDSVVRLLAWARGTESPPKSQSETLVALSWPPVPKPVEHVSASARELPAALKNGLPRFSLISSDANLGFAGGNNVALRALLDTGAKGYVCLLNSDMVVEPSAFRALIESAKEPDLAAVGGVILDYNEPARVQSVGGGTMSRLSGMAEIHGAGLHRADIRAPSGLGYISGGLLLTRVDTLRYVGLMDESYFLYAEDADWGERMRAQGYRLGCSLAATTWHKGSATNKARSPFQDFYIVRSSLMFVRKHAPRYTIFALLSAVVRFLVPKVVRGEWRRVQSVVRAYVSYSRGV